jgi:hypothetical protein
MKKVLLLTMGIVLSDIVYSQQPLLDEYNEQRQKINKKGLLVLSSWSAANIIYGTIASSQTHGSTKYFHRMNAIWNSVTLGISTFGYLAAKKDKGLSYPQSLKQQSNIEKVFIANAGVDLAYIAGGFYLKERSKAGSKNPDRSKGYGESIVLQGSVLFLFDALMYAIHNKHGKQLYKMAEKINLSTTDNGMGMVIQL